MDIIWTKYRKVISKVINVQVQQITDYKDMDAQVVS